MMNFKKNTSFSIMLLGIFAVSFALQAHANPPVTSSQPPQINPFCTEGDVPVETRDICTKLVENVKTWEEAAMISVKRVSEEAVKSTKPVLATIDAKLDTKLALSDRTQIIDACRKGYQAAIEGLKQCPNLITIGPFSSYESALTSVYTSIEDCKDAVFEEKGQPEIVEVTKFTKDIQKLIDVALVIAKKDPRVADYNAKLARGEFKDSAGDPSLIGPISTTFYGANP